MRNGVLIVSLVMIVAIPAAFTISPDPLKSFRLIAFLGVVLAAVVAGGQVVHSYSITLGRVAQERPLLDAFISDTFIGRCSTVTTLFDRFLIARQAPEGNSTNALFEPPATRQVQVSLFRIDRDDPLARTGRWRRRAVLREIYTTESRLRPGRRAADGRRGSRSPMASDCVIVDLQGVGGVLLTMWNDGFVAGPQSLTRQHLGEAPRDSNAIVFRSGREVLDHPEVIDLVSDGENVIVPMRGQRNALAFATIVHFNGFDGVLVVALRDVEPRVLESFRVLEEEIVRRNEEEIVRRKKAEKSSDPNRADYKDVWADSADPLPDASQEACDVLTRVRLAAQQVRQMIRLADLISSGGMEVVAEHEKARLRAAKTLHIDSFVRGYEVDLLTLAKGVVGDEDKSVLAMLDERAKELSFDSGKRSTFLALMSTAKQTPSSGEV